MFEVVFMWDRCDILSAVVTPISHCALRQWQRLEKTTCHTFLTQNSRPVTPFSHRNLDLSHLSHTETRTCHTFLTQKSGPVTPFSQRNQSWIYVTESCHLKVITRTQNLSNRTQIHGFGAEKRLQTGTAISLWWFRFLVTVYGEDLTDQNGQKYHKFRFEYEAK